MAMESTADRPVPLHMRHSPALLQLTSPRCSQDGRKRDAGLLSPRFPTVVSHLLSTSSNPAHTTGSASAARPLSPPSPVRISPADASVGGVMRGAVTPTPTARVPAVAAAVLSPQWGGGGTTTGGRGGPAGAGYSPTPRGVPGGGYSTPTPSSFGASRSGPSRLHPVMSPPPHRSTTTNTATTITPSRPDDDTQLQLTITTTTPRAAAAAAARGGGYPAMTTAAQSRVGRSSVAPNDPQSSDQQQQHSSVQRRLISPHVLFRSKPAHASASPVSSLSTSYSSPYLSK